MTPYPGKFYVKDSTGRKCAPVWMIYLSFLYIEVFSLLFLSIKDPFSWKQMWPLAFGLLWAVILTGIVLTLPRKLSRIAYGGLYFFMAVYAGFQTGYYNLFTGMMWLSDFRYASEGASYADVLLSYPIGWWLGIAAMIVLGIVMIWRFPERSFGWKGRSVALVLAAAAAVGAYFLPNAVFYYDTDNYYDASDFGRSQSEEGAYKTMFNTYRLYQVCGVYQTAVKDIYANYIFPLTPGYLLEQQAAREKIDAYFQNQSKGGENAMTGLLKDKNIVLVLMESMDDWMMGEHTPTLNRLMEEGINFTRFYTPPYGGIRTFNTEFCINTGSFLSSRGGYAFDYVTNTYNQSLAATLRNYGYHPLTFHYNDPLFYSRDVFTPAMGYNMYISYMDHVSDQKDPALYDDQLLFDAEGLANDFFRPGKKLNFVITRSAHLSYKYNEVLSHWGLKKYPQYRGLTGNEETDCAYLKARLVDDFFDRLLKELEEHQELENTVIIGVTDHYTYGYKNMDALLELSGVQEEILLEKTPCFIWSPGLEAQEVDKVLNTSDLMPTVLNLLGVESDYPYIGSDAFDEGYDGFVPFSNGSWIYGDTVYDGVHKKLYSISGKQHSVSAQLQENMARRVSEFVEINNLILETDYYK